MPAHDGADGEALCRFALDLFDETDAIALRHVADGLRVRAKTDATLVTQVDTELGALLRDRVHDALLARLAAGGGVAHGG